jgi:hypothetical protein
MSGMQDKFYSGVEKASNKARKQRNVVAKTKRDADNSPELLAEKIVRVVLDCLKQTRIAVLEDYGVDLADTEAIRNYKAKSVAEWQIISWLATRHQIYSSFLQFVGQLFRDPNLTGDSSAKAVCEAFVEATEMQLLAVALDFYELQEKLPEESFPQEEMAKVLSGIVDARTSLSGERRDSKELRERLVEAGEKPRKQLRVELPAEVLDLFYKMLQEDEINPSLKDLVNEARRRIRRVGASRESVAERRLGERSELNEPEVEGSGPEQVLEAVWASELLHDLIDKSNLSGQERETFLALAEMTSEEAAEKLGRSAYQVRQEKLRAIRKLRRAAGL